MQTKIFSHNECTGEFIIRTEQIVTTRRIWGIEFSVIFLDGKYRLTCPYSGWALFETINLKELDEKVVQFQEYMPVQAYIRKLLDAFRITTIEKLPDCRTDKWPFGKGGEHERV